MRVSPPFAAFLNAFASHVLDLDDVYNPPGTTVHGSCSVWPAIMAVADTRPVTGQAALATFALGFEVETRVAHAAGESHYDVGWHVSGTSGHVGAAAAAARAMGLDHQQVEHAIAAGATQAAGLRVMAGSDLKSMHPGKAAMDGVLAAALVEQRLTASPKALEGDFGYLAVMSAQARSPSDQRGTRRDVEHHVQRPQALSEWIFDPSHDRRRARPAGAENISPAEVTEIDVRVSPAAARFTDLPRPTTRMQAKFSLRHCAAAAVAFGRLGTPELEQEVLVRARHRRIARPGEGRRGSRRSANRTPTSRSPSPPGARCRPRYVATEARPPHRWTTTSSARSSATWSVLCSARSAPEDFSRPVGTSRNSRICRCCWLRPCPHWMAESSVRRCR